MVAQRKASIDSAEANLTLAKLTYDRTKQLVTEGHAPLQRLDEVTDQLEVARRSTDQAKLAYEDLGAWLDGSGEMPATVAETAGLKEQIELQKQAAERLRATR